MLPRTYSSAVIGSSETWATSVSRTSGSELPVVEVALLGGRDHGVAAADADPGDPLAVVGPELGPVLDSLVVRAPDEHGVVRRHGQDGLAPVGLLVGHLADRPAAGVDRDDAPVAHATGRGRRASGPRSAGTKRTCCSETRPSSVPRATKSPIEAARGARHLRLRPREVGGSCREKRPSARPEGGAPVGEHLVEVALVLVGPHDEGLARGRSRGERSPVLRQPEAAPGAGVTRAGARRRGRPSPSPGRSRGGRAAATRRG